MLPFPARDNSMHVILVSVGTDGDIFPYVGMGTLLRERGHKVTLVASEDYEPLARTHDLAFRRSGVSQRKPGVVWAS